MTRPDLSPVLRLDTEIKLTVVRVSWMVSLPAWAYQGALVAVRVAQDHWGCGHDLLASQGLRAAAATLRHQAGWTLDRERGWVGGDDRGVSLVAEELESLADKIDVVQAALLVS